MSMRGAGFSMMRMSRHDREVLDHRLSKGLLRRVIGFGREYRWQVLGLLIMVVVDAGLGVIPPLLFKSIIDRGVLAGDAAVVVRLALLVAVLAVVDAGLSVVQRWLSSRIGEGLIFDLRTQVYDHVLRMPIAFFSRTQTGKLVSRLNSDVIGAQQAFTSTMITVVSSSITLITTLIAMLLLSWPLTLAALVLLPIFVIPARLMGRRLAGMTREQMQLNGELSEAMTERFSVSGALLVKLFGRQRDEHEVIASRAGAVRDVSVRIALNGRLFITALTLVAALATALVYGVGGVFAIQGSLTVGTLTALAGLLARLYGPITQLTNVRIDVMTALVSFERVFEVLDLPPMIDDRPDATQYGGPPSVEFDHVGFSYPRAEEVSLASLEVIARTESRPDNPVLYDVDFVARPGQTVALVGPSGAGKTTITHLVARLYDPTSGAVRVGGTDVRELRQDSLHRAIGYVTQDAHLFHDTIRNNLRYARPEADDAALMAALYAAQVGDLVATLPDGLDTVVGERGYRLSGGERQRLAIARLLLKAPPIVVLDEATAHLDSESEVAVQRALDQAMQGRTSLVIAHRLSTVRNADQILVVDHGRIVESGTHDQLLAVGGLYAELYRTQFSEAADGTSTVRPTG
ncbi:ABC transporter ATP-binding protein [Microlunatus sp. Gsoil 973]|uniref:ABC transporter ATP-binding protein n=1 Tax=Microlunatus sp. Gsoil 973 TaxID=2672569 RepID=UPI0012B4B8F8|nr:ABC transporter ATP-binding protein [Microlunatus sp. Gsoil 973]QGN31987.1 ATP-binding cassette domain-containing protein [Microlunatus sp. Gsoil 973]